eukprot:14280213-Alexandrium_andersonii.AAC.1
MPFRGPRCSSSEFRQHYRMFSRADCALRRIAAPTGLERIADRTFGAKRCEGPSLGNGEVDT